MQSTSFPKNRISVLLLENIHDKAAARFEQESFNVRRFTGSLDPEQLKEEIKTAHVIGIRSKTKLTKEILAEGNRLLAVGAFCIGTNQIDLTAAAKKGVAVFNAPFSNTRSVAELVISHIVSLSRRIPEKNRAAHEGRWLKSAEGSREVRGKTVGIIGYGHIGSQVSVMAESLGMNVIFHDIVDKLAMGNAVPAESLDDLLERSDFVTLHVPATPETEMMMNAKRIALMKEGSFLINYSRGNVVDIDVLAESLRDKKLAGAAIDVFPEEPKAVGESFKSPLQGFENVILTPHIGGSTLEAQKMIGAEVSSKVIKFINNGSTTSAVNLPEVELPEQIGTHRILHIHKNEAGVLHKINSLFADKGINVLGQHLLTNPDTGYLVMDVSTEVNKTILDDLKKIEETIKVRILY